MSKVFWAVRYRNDIWVTQVNPTQGRYGAEGKKRRHLFKLQRDALRVASKIVYPPVQVVKVTRQPKPAPELKVGDAVLVRGKLVELSPYEARIVTGRTSFWVGYKAIIPAKEK